MRKRIAMLLALLLILSGCGSKGKTAYVPTGNALEGLEISNAVTDATEPEPEQEVKLTWHPDEGTNPFLCGDFTNRALFSLLYQGLFSVSRDYVIEPILCSSYYMSEDMRDYTFYVDTNATFSDGSHVTPEDVYASFQTVLNSPLYEGRFFYVWDVELQEDKGIHVSLYYGYENLPLLLDFPIIKASQQEVENPLGTGPYYLSDSPRGKTLEQRNPYWCETDLLLTAPSIPLMTAQSNSKIRDDFEFNNLSIVCTDPGTDYFAEFHSDCEVWEVDTGIFLYLAVSSESDLADNQGLRSALTYAIDRESLVDHFYRGYARAASLPCSPLSPYYSSGLAQKYAYDPILFKEKVDASGLKGRELVMLVNGGDSLRVRLARDIAQMLSDGGLPTTLVERAGYEYEEYLNWGDYDLYLGQTQLSKNMDLSQFFYEWGYLSKAGIDDEELYTKSLEALSNSGNFYTLHQSVMEQGQLTPILFRSYAIYAARGLVTDLEPARDNIFYYSIGRSLADAEIILEDEY